MLASLLFTFTYATLAAKSRRAEMVRIPLLDALQSVPILGYLSVTVVFSRIVSGTWRFPLPCRVMIWNMMMSMSGGWFFVVASEAISVGTLHVSLPGVGSYVARAIEVRDLAAIGWAIVAMSAAIVLYDQLLFRPLVAWAERFRSEQTAAQTVSRSWVLDLLRRSRLIALIGAPVAGAWQRGRRARFAFRPHLNSADTGKTLRTAIGWGRYAELFSYDDQARTFALAPAAP